LPSRKPPSPGNKSFSPNFHRTKSKSCDI
jgi:hypothetical protein